MANASPAPAGVGTLAEAIERGGIGILHFAGHGMFNPSLLDATELQLADGSVFRPMDLDGPVQTTLGQDRPLVFLNACRAAQQAWSCASLGSWADRWVRVRACGAFIGQQWRVKDSVALAFASASRVSSEPEPEDPLASLARR